jgi:hypothetical protein
MSWIWGQIECTVENIIKKYYRPFSVIYGTESGGKLLSYPPESGSRPATLMDFDIKGVRFIS